MDSTKYNTYIHTADDNERDHLNSRESFVGPTRNQFNSHLQ